MVFSGAKRPGRAVDHSSLSGTEVKKNVATFLLSSYAFLEYKGTTSPFSMLRIWSKFGSPHQ